jgi:hypothetical protein
VAAVVIARFADVHDDRAVTVGGGECHQGNFTHADSVYW